MFRLLLLNNVPILEQLRLEEALLRTDSDNWCLINTGSPPAIVMGISGKPEQLLDIDKINADRIPVIKRFSGGGTVYIDPQTVFITWICNESCVGATSNAQAILQWSETLYKPLFQGFCLRENDYVFGEKKFGGNALYIQKKRWLLHTSLLWSYDPSKMDYLLMPHKRPQYRQNRSHHDFLCTLDAHYPTRQGLIEALNAHVKKVFPTTLISHSAVSTAEFPPHRMSTIQIF